YFNNYTDDRRITFTSNPVGTAPRQRRQWDEDQLGVLANLTWRLDDRITLDLGANHEQQDNRYRRYRFNYALPTNFETPALVQNNDRYTLDNTGAYVQAILRPSPTLKVIPALRVDQFSGRTTNQTTGATAALQDAGWIKQPKLSMVYSPFESISLYANWGKTFQILTGSGSPAYLFAGQPTFAPSTNTGKELGVKFKPAPRTDVRLALWQQDATGEVANMPSTGTTVGLGETRRQGLDIQLRDRVTDQLDLWVSHSLQKAEVVRAFTGGGASLAGKEVFSTPRYISNAGLEYRPTQALRVGVQGRAQGDYFIDSPNALGKYGAFVLFDANLRYVVSPRLSVDVQVKNLADRKYAYVWYDNFFWPANNPQAMFSSGPGRSAHIALNLTL
ncbi:MAG: TonB-dependent receptor, partial [Burkholderiaceae bacterium]|nr:TonB-dependent receptor [Burkholderiaceae bacterium]